MWRDKPYIRRARDTIPAVFGWFAICKGEGRGDRGDLGRGVGKELGGNSSTLSLGRNFNCAKNSIGQVDETVGA